MLQGVHLSRLSITRTVTASMDAPWPDLGTETRTEMGTEARTPGQERAWKPPGQGMYT